jgi:hypothetical protein
MKEWFWYIKIHAVWTLMVLLFVTWLLPESGGLWIAIAIAFVAAPAIWVVTGVASYWLAVAFDRLTGLGFHLPGNPLIQRHPKSQAMVGVVLFATVLAAIPFTWAHRKQMVLPVRQVGRGLSGVVVSGKPSGSEDGWYRLQYVPGTETYEQARAHKTDAVWLPLTDAEICDDPDTASVNH